MVLKNSRVDEMIPSANFFILSLKLLALKNPFKIEPKIFFKFDYEGYGKHNIMECLVNLLLSWFLPPLGVAPHPIRVVSTICFQKSFALS